MPNAPVVSQIEFEAEVLQSTKPALVCFGAPWSKPSQIVYEMLQELAQEPVTDANLFCVNVDDNPDLGSWYDIQSVPTLLWFVNGRVRARVVGTVSKQAALGRLQAVMQETSS